MPLFFIWLSEETVTFALHVINILVFITEAESVYCAVRTESLYIFSTAARALPLQNPYTKCMSQYSMWENTKGIFFNSVQVTNRS